MEFMDIVVRWPGSYHDSFIFSGSYANKYFDECTNNILLLGDGGSKFFSTQYNLNIYNNE